MILSSFLISLYKTHVPLLAHLYNAENFRERISLRVDGWQQDKEMVRWGV